MTCTFSLPLNPPISLHNNRHRRHRMLSPPPLFSKSTSLSRSLSNSHICFSSSSNPDLTEEFLWLREEQRWLQERDSLLAQIQSLKLRIQALEKRVSAEDVEVGGDMAVNVAALLQVLKERNLIAESGSSTSSSSILVEKNVEEEVKKEVIPKNEEEKERRALRKGSEGQLVREMQV